MTKLKQKIELLKSLGVDIYKSPSFVSGKLKAKDFSKFVDETIKYMKWKIKNGEIKFRK